MNAKKRATPQKSVDPDDAPELNDAFFARADEYVGNKLVRRGRPKAASTKVALTMRYDAKVIEAFRAGGAGWQTRMNAALSDWLKAHQKA